MRFSSYSDVGLPQQAVPTLQRAPVDAQAQHGGNGDDGSSHAEGAAVYSDTQELEAVPDVGGAAAMDEGPDEVPVLVRKPVTSTKVPQKPAPRAVQKRSESDEVFVRGFPRYLMNEVQSVFPGASSMADALAAFVCVKMDHPVDVPDDVKELVHGYTGDNVLQGMEEHLAALDQQNKYLITCIQELKLGLAYLIADYRGFVKGMVKDGMSLNFMDPSVEDVMDRMRSMNLQKQKRDAVKSGRTIR